MFDPFVPGALAERLRGRRRRACTIAEIDHEPSRPVFAEVLDRQGRGTGQFVRLSQGMVERITRAVRAAT
ncbi:hypothetical protein [Methylobacterium sp. A54F]